MKGIRKEGGASSATWNEGYKEGRRGEQCYMEWVGGGGGR